MQAQTTTPYPYYYYMPVPVEGDQQPAIPLTAFVESETPKPQEPSKQEAKKAKKAAKKAKKLADAEGQKKQRKPKFKKLSGCHKFFVVIGSLALIGFLLKLIGVGVALTVLSQMYHSCENPPHRVERQWSTVPHIVQTIKIDVTSAIVHVRTCPHAKSIVINSVSRSKIADDLDKMIPSYVVMDGTLGLTAKFPGFDFDSCASVKLDIIVPENLPNKIGLNIVTETGVIHIAPNKAHNGHHERTNVTQSAFADVIINTKAGHVEIDNVNTNGYVTVYSKIGGITLRNIGAPILSATTQTGFIDATYLRIGQATLLADSGSVVARGIVFETKTAFELEYSFQAIVDLGHLEVKGIRNKLAAGTTAAVNINSGSGYAKVKLSKKSNMSFDFTTESGSIELHGKDLPELVENKETSKSGRIEGEGALTAVTLSTGSGRAHVVFGECKKWHKKDGDNEHEHGHRHHDKEHKGKDETDTEEHKVDPHHVDPREETQSAKPKHHEGKKHHGDRKRPERTHQA